MLLGVLNISNIRKKKICEVFSFFWEVVEWKSNKKNQAGVEITMEKQGDRNVGQKVVYR